MGDYGVVTGTGWPGGLASERQGAPNLGWPGRRRPLRRVSAAQPPPPRRPRRKWVRFAVASCLAMVLLVAGGLVAVRTLVERYDSSVARESLLDPNARQGEY